MALGFRVQSSASRVQLIQTQEAFDGVAQGYDASNAANPLLAAMRQRTLAVVRSRLPDRSRILDLGCGPGTDAVRLAEMGYRVTAIDWSPAMIVRARERVAAADLEGAVETRQLGIHELNRLEAEPFDGAYSNFGPLNCVPDLPEAARRIFAAIRPGGFLIASVVGRLCPWEILRYALVGNWRRALIRFRPHFVPVPLEGLTVWTHYYSPSEFAKPFEIAGFERLSVRGLGVFVPPPYLQAFGTRHPKIIAVLQRLDDATGGWPGFRHMGDHFLIVMRRPDARASAS